MVSTGYPLACLTVKISNSTLFFGSKCNAMCCCLLKKCHLQLEGWLACTQNNNFKKINKYILNNIENVSWAMATTKTLDPWPSWQGHLDGLFFGVKLARPLLADRNRPDVMNKWVDYATWFMNHAVVRYCVFVDECGYNIWTARSHGRVWQGERAYHQVCGQRGRNLTVTMAISPINGLVFSSAVLGRMNAARFHNFLAQARTNLDPDEEVIFV